MKRSLFAIILICVFICLFALSFGLSVIYFSKKGAVETGETADEKAENLAGPSSQLSDGYEYAEIGDILENPKEYHGKNVWIQGVCIVAVHTVEKDMFLKIRGRDGSEIYVNVLPGYHGEIPGMHDIQIGATLKIFGVVLRVPEVSTYPFVNAKKIINLHSIQRVSIQEILNNPKRWKGKEVSVHGTCLSKEKCEGGYWVTLGYPEFMLHISFENVEREWADNLSIGNTPTASGVVKFRDGEPYLETLVICF
jgi:hypothetical protein